MSSCPVLRTAAFVKVFRSDMKPSTETSIEYTSMHRNVFETTLPTSFDVLVLAEFEQFGFLQVRFVTDT